MSSFQTLAEDSGSAASESISSTSSSARPAASAVAAASSDPVKPVAAKGEAGKSEISGAVFNLANAVREGCTEPRAVPRGGSCCAGSLPLLPMATTHPVCPPPPLSPSPLPSLPQIIGAGVGGMPYALKLAGFYGGIFLIGLVAYCSDYTLRLLITLSRKTKSKYYEDLMTTQFGQRGYLFVVGAMGIFAYGAMVAYLMGIGA
jgi:hypothetical protein